MSVFKIFYRKKRTFRFNLMNEVYKDYLEEKFPSGIESIQLPTTAEKALKLNALRRLPSKTITVRLIFTVTVEKEKALEFFNFLISDPNSQFTELREYGFPDIHRENQDLTLDEFESLINRGRELDISFILFSKAFGTTICVVTKTNKILLETIYFTFTGQSRKK